MGAGLAVHSCQSGKVWPGMTRAFVVGANELAKYSHRKYVYYATNISCVDHNAKIHVSMLKGEAMIIADPWEAQ